MFICSATPSTELVNKVRDLYERNGQDVRFLIPILNGLEKVLQFDNLYYFDDNGICHREKLSLYCLN